MSFWQRWVRQPQRVWLRRALFQIHLWTGLILGLYVVMLSVTGSALVYRNELDRFFATPRPTFDPNAKRLTTEELQARAEREYPGWKVTRVGDRITRRNPTIEIWVERGSEKKERLFNPYTGEDLGDTVTLKIALPSPFQNRPGRSSNSSSCNRASHSTKYSPCVTESPRSSPV